MATVYSVGVFCVAEVVSQTTATGVVTRALRRDQAITVGDTRTIVLARVAGFVPDSTVTYVVGEYEVIMLHNLSDPTDEVAYIHNIALADQQILMSRSFWRALTGVKELIAEPELTPSVRIGNVIEYHVTAQVSIVP